MKMNLIDKYIAKTILSAIALVTLMLAGLQIFILFVNQLDDIGKGNYDIIQAGWFVLLQTPYQVYLFFPMASLLGCLIGLGIMANNRELVVMRAAGMSIWQVTQAVLKAAFIVIVIVTLISETLVPRLATIGNNDKIQSISSGQALRTGKGLWMRFQNDFINIGSILPDLTLQHVYQFRFDTMHNLRVVRKMVNIKRMNNEWVAFQVSESVLEDKMIKAKEHAQIIWDVPLKPTLLNVGSSEPDEMTLMELHTFITAQKKANQNTFNYQLAYWQRLVQPLTTLVMMVLAIPFIFGPLRSSTMGSKFLAGATVGFGFHIINRFFGPISQVLQWPPEIAALGPTLIFAFLGLYLMRRVR